jgi:hypothetical protein
LKQDEVILDFRIKETETIDILGCPDILYRVNWEFLYIENHAQPYFKKPGCYLLVML